MTIRTMLAGVLIVICAAATAQDIDTARQAYEDNDYETALRILHPLAEGGDADAQYTLGVAYNFGEGVPQDHAEAVRWYRMAAEQGNSSAQNNLGTAYNRGEGVPQNYVEAVKWYRMAAEQGDAAGQVNLGTSYYAGEGVPQNYAEAAKWYRMAAVQGHAGGQYSFGIMAALLQFPEQAHAWFNLAAAQGLEPAREARDNLQSRMSREQIAEAQRIASSWKPGSPLGLGEGVSFIQWALQQLGHSPGTIDGRIGPRTRSAIRAFQQGNGLPVDGEVSAKLVQALRNALADQAIEDASDMH